MKVEYAIDEIARSDQRMGLAAGRLERTLTVELVSAVHGSFAPIWPLQGSSPAGVHSPC